MTNSILHILGFEEPLDVSPMATSPHSNPEVADSSLARSQCPYGSGFTPRLRLAR
ncbi:hypothetical protein Hanom_Chr11g01013191 [Helianthus anomalus]